MENDGGPKLFFQYLELSYKSFLSGDDDQYLALEGSFSDKIIKNQNEIEATIEVMEKENLELEMEIQRAEMEKSTLPQLNSKKKDFESDLEKFKTLITALGKILFRKVIYSCLQSYITQLNSWSGLQLTT